MAIPITDNDREAAFPALPPRPSLSRPVVYVSAPFAAPRPDGVARNVARACLIARFALYESRAPWCVHPMIAPIFGTDGSAAVRAVGLACDVAHVGMIAKAGFSEFWMLLTDNGNLTKGMQAEWAEWCAVRGIAPSLTVGAIRGVRAGTWVQWEQSARRAGLLAEWTALAVPGLKVKAVSRISRDVNR